MKRDADKMKNIVLDVLELLAQKNTLVLADEVPDRLRQGEPIEKSEKLGIKRVLDSGKQILIGAVERSILHELQKQGLVIRDGVGFEISGGGRGYLRRCQDNSDPFQFQHQDRRTVTIQENGRTRSVLANKSESPLAWLLKRRGKDGKSLINDEQFNAGERLREDFCFAQMSPSVTANWSAPAAGKSRRRGPSSGSDMTDNVIAAKERVSSALNAVGPELAGSLIDVCCHMNGLEALEKSNGWPQRSGKIVLVLALSSLARHYGMNGEEKVRRGEYETWNAFGSRPHL